MAHASKKALPAKRDVTAFCCIAALILAALLQTACSELQKPSASPYFANAQPPAKKEFRWTNGRLPKSFDPATAEVPPETDVVRAVFEGLTVIDPKTLDAIPGVASKWSSPADKRTWTFALRQDARWTNGERVTADDFVRSWDRLATMGDNGAHHELLNNFARLKPIAKPKANPSDLPNTRPEPTPVPESDSSVVNKPAIDHVRASEQSQTAPPANMAPQRLAVRAIDESSLEVKLDEPDADLPRLLADPIFSPVYADGGEFDPSAKKTDIVTNGPFRIASYGKDGVVLARSENYHDSASVALDSVRFVPTDSAEDALEAYRAGSVDAVTNSEFEPLALKLLSPYQDFRKVTHGALNLYEVNRSRPPFSDRRVREALAISIERERLTEGEMEGATHAAFRFLPFGGSGIDDLVQDTDRARSLLDAAGYPNGEGFPTIRLVINRNDTQQRIAKAVARMWKQNLGVNTEIAVAEMADMEQVRAAGDYDIIRRGVVFPTGDATSNLSLLFGLGAKDPLAQTAHRPTAENSNSAFSNREIDEPPPGLIGEPVGVPTESEALYQFTSIPLYFPATYLLVKPYVQGFEPNGLDVMSLKDVRVDNSWQPSAP
jgi:oligopeptide transport system substrate-binding protein